MANVVLTEDDSLAVREQVIAAVKNDVLFRQMDHEEYKRRMEKQAESRLHLDQRYRSHVMTSNVLNIISTAAVVALCIAVIKFVSS